MFYVVLLPYVCMSIAFAIAFDVVVLLMLCVLYVCDLMWCEKGFAATQPTALVFVIKALYGSVCLHTLLPLELYYELTDLLLKQACP